LKDGDKEGEVKVRKKWRGWGRVEGVDRGQRNAGDNARVDALEKWDVGRAGEEMGDCLGAGAEGAVSQIRRDFESGTGTLPP
jgi:hypothetical protein